MLYRLAKLATLSATMTVFASPVLAAGETVITQAKALAGNVTPGDTAGFPVTLSQSGAYVLESNLTVTPGTYGLFVTANNVDIDMNGFTLSSAGGGTYGVISSFGESRIHDGHINMFRYSGIYLRGNAWVIKNMKIVRNGTMGIDATNARSITVQDSLVARNRNRGVVTGDNGVFRNNTISDNSDTGLFCDGTCHIEDNAIDGNGVYGVLVATGFLLGNSISGNISTGIVDVPPSNVGLANNMLSYNSSSLGSEQIFGGVDVHPNTCNGLPC